jgi:cytochrome c oxidase assembly factor CtaG
VWISSLAYSGAKRLRRHRQGWQLAELAERCWRAPLGLAVVIFAACGPAHAFGHTDFVFFAVLVGLALAGIAVPLALLGLRAGTPAEETP